MNLSIITPHYQNVEGLKAIYDCLMRQSSNQWEWIIVDDCSEPSIKASFQDYFKDKLNAQIRLIFNDIKTNASVCRNLGIDHAKYSNLVFLDSDDTVTDSFVANRLINVKEFVVFPHYFIKNELGDVYASNVVSSNYLDHFLKAHFIWQTTSILWNKKYLIDLGTFDPKLERLQDVELSIRGLYNSKDFKVIENVPDFYYHVKPIKTRTIFVPIVCSSVQYLISFIHENYKLEPYQYRLLSGYYFMCVKYLHRLQFKSNVVYVRQCLTLFYSKKDMTLFKYLIGHILLDLFKFKLISNDLFIRTNRYFFKPKLKAEH